MKGKVGFIILLISAMTLNAAELTNTNEKDLGSGFYELSGTDSGIQVRYLQYGEKKLGQLGNYSISPSGSYAAFQDTPAGNLYLFRVYDQSLEQLTKEFIAPASKYTWNETLEILDVKFKGNTNPKSFAIE
jgi:hypothetical protein